MERRIVIVVMFALCSFFLGACAVKAPNGAIWKEEKVLRPTAPEGFSAVLGWAQVATLEPEFSGKMVKVYVDYFRLIESDGKNEKIITEEEYDIDAPYLSSGSGGLFTRQPRWFANDDHEVIKNSMIKNSVLILNADETPDKILHWWTDRADTKPGARYIVEMKVKIKGEACLQLGLDYWINGQAGWNGWDANCAGTNNCEGFVSDWYCASWGWGYKVIRAPKK